MIRASLLVLALLASPALAKEKPFPNADGSETPTPASANAAAAKSSSGSSVIDDVANFINGDVVGAAKMAAEPPNVDGNGYACWTAGQPLSAQIKEHPLLFTLHGATDIEAQRKLVKAARDVCDNLACQQVSTDLAIGIQQVISSLPISINGPLNINVFQSACLKIPHLAFVPIPADLLPTPAPSAPTTAPAAVPAGGN